MKSPPILTLVCFFDLSTFTQWFCRLFFCTPSRYFFFLSALGGLLLLNQLYVLYFFFQVQKRFMDLLNLFKASSGDRTRESTNEDSCSEDEAEDEEDSETICESDGEQAHDA